MEEKRVHPRVQIQLDVTCDVPDRGIVSGTATDLSMGGMFIESSDTVPFGTKLTIHTRFSEGEFKLPGVVRWSKPGGFGVQFGLLGARETHVLSRMMKR